MQELPKSSVDNHILCTTRQHVKSSPNLQETIYSFWKSSESYLSRGSVKPRLTSTVRCFTYLHAALSMCVCFNLHLWKHHRMHKINNSVNRWLWWLMSYLEFYTNESSFLLVTWHQLPGNPEANSNIFHDRQTSVVNKLLHCRCDSQPQAFIISWLNDRF